MKKYIPQNSQIEIGDLGDEKAFVAGITYRFIEWAKFQDKLFKKGTKVSWYCDDTNRTYKGRIEWMIIIENGEIEVSIDHADLGRLPLTELKFVR